MTEKARRKFPPAEYSPSPPWKRLGWPHLSEWGDVAEIQAAMVEHKPNDFAAASERVCDWCIAERVDNAEPAAWKCRHCAISMCERHHDFLGMGRSGEPKPQ